MEDRGPKGVGPVDQPGMRLRFRLPYQPSQDARTRTTLPISRSPDPDVEFLASDDEAPVWPVNSAEERVTVERMAKLFGAAVVEADAHPGVVEPESEERVMGVGLAAEEVALYCHLTGRRPMRATRVDELVLDDPPAVVLFCDKELDRELLQFLALATYGRQAPGVVWGRTPRELHLRVLAASCGAVLNGPVATPHRSIVGPGVGRVETRLAADELLQRLGEGVGVLSLHGHGNGVAQDLAVGAALCARLNSHPGDPARGPECLYTDVCRLLERPFTEAREQGMLVAPGAIAARVLLNTSCHGAFLGSASVDSAWSTFPDLATSPRVGALIVTPELSLTLPESTTGELVKALTGGETAGRAIVRFEENPTVQEVGLRLILFGDPRVRAAPANGLNIIERDTQSVQTWRRSSQVSVVGRREEAPDALSQIGLLRSLACSTVPETKERGELTSRNLLSSLAELEEEDDVAVSIGGGPGQRVREAVLDHLATTKVRLYQVWEQGAVVRRDQGLATCPQCGWRSKPMRVTCAAGTEREFMICPYCVDVWDNHVPVTVKLSLDLPNVNCDWTEPPVGWAAAVYIVSSRAKNTQMMRWPALADGSPVRNVVVDSDLAPPGPSRVYAIWLDGLAISSACAPVARSSSASSRN